jgi:hypothetical protein
LGLPYVLFVAESADVMDSVMTISILVGPSCLRDAAWLPAR